MSSCALQIAQALRKNAVILSLTDNSNFGNYSGFEARYQSLYKARKGSQPD
jgi:hypothetical protein